MVRKCAGTAEGVACVFGLGGKEAQPKPGNSRCSWCEPSLLQHVAPDKEARGRLTYMFRNFSDEVQAQALERLPASEREFFRNAAHEANPSTIRPRKRPAASDGAKQDGAKCAKPVEKEDNVES